MGADGNNGDSNRLLWDKVAEQYPIEIDDAERKLAEHIRSIIEQNGILPGSKILELGCGSGHLSACLAQRGYEVTLVDYSFVSLEKAKLTFEKYALTAEFVLADMFDLESLYGKKYDLVWNSGVMEHFDDESLLNALVSIKKLGAPKFLFLVPNPDSIAYLLMRFNLFANDRWEWGTEYLRDNYEDYLKQTGMSVIDISYCGEEISKFHAITGGLNESGARAYATLTDNKYLPDSEKYLIGYMADLTGSGKESNTSGKKSDIGIISLRTQLFEELARSHGLTIECDLLNAKVDALANENQSLTSENQGLASENQTLTDENQSLTSENQTLTNENQTLTNNNQDLTNENQSLTSENQTILSKHSKILGNIDSIAEHANTIYVRMSDKKIRRWIRIFDLGATIKHANFVGKIKIAAKIALRFFGIRKAFYPPPTIPTKLLNDNLLAIAANVEEARKENTGKAANTESNAEIDRKAAEQDFIQYKKERNEKYLIQSSNIGIPCVKGLVSIVLPVYNGGDLLAQSIESVLAQTYRDFELIIVNDGSTDDTPNVIEKYASKDLRIRVVTQENQKLPRALTNGFNIARGEYFTWTSADNNMYPDFVEKLIAELECSRQTDMVYANVNIIDENGAPLPSVTWYPHPQIPHCVMYPHSTTTLNLGINNTVGSAFMYRASVAHTIGEYSAFRFTAEDLDYWMRVNELFELRHTSFEEPIYDYRWHSKTLTARREELKIDEHARNLATFDMFRRYFLLRPLRWRLQGFEASNPLHIQFMNTLISAGHSLIETEEDFSKLRSYNNAHIVYFNMNSSNEEPVSPDNCYTVLMYAQPSEEISSGCHCLISEKSVTSSDYLSSFKGWYSFTDGKDMFNFLDIRAKSHFLLEMESPGYVQANYGMGKTRRIEKDSEILVSVIIPVYNVESYLERCVRSVLNQSYQNLEIILVDDGSPDNCPALCEAYAKEDSRVKVIHKQNGGLSDARNAGIDIALGDYILFVDSDDWIESDMIELLLKNALQYDADISECSYTNVYNDYSKPETGNSGIIIEADSLTALEGMLDWKYFLPVVWNKLYRKEIFNHIRYPVGKVHEDEFTTYRCYLAAEKIVYMDTYKYYYNQMRTNSITGQEFKLSYLDAYFGFEERLHYFWTNKFCKLEPKMNNAYAHCFLDRVFNCKEYNLLGVLSDEIIYRGLLNINRMRFENRPIDDSYLCAASLLEESIDDFAEYWREHHVVKLF